MDRQNRPRPRTKFSPNSSGTMYLMLDTLTLLIKPLIDFLSASHAIRWYSLLVLSVICACSARSRAGGMYVPPDRMFKSFSYSALAAACFSSAVIGLRAASCFSCSRTRSASWRSRSIARRSSIRGTSSSSRCESPGGERRRLGEGDREGGERFRAPAVGEIAPGGGVGTRTADCRTTGSDMMKFQRHRKAR